jgi:hypothetical protein
VFDATNSNSVTSLKSGTFWLPQPARGGKVEKMPGANASQIYGSVMIGKLAIS